ncbi:DUF559 domain-containing protein, partial [bacterium]|nr:DUF559 domain-containing protein [bacterium]
MSTSKVVDTTKFTQVMEKWNIPITVFNETTYVRANDLGEKLKLSNIHGSIESYGKKEKIKMPAITKTGPQLVSFLSIIGVQRVICSSRKPDSILMCKDLGIHCQLKLCPVETTYIDCIKKAFRGEHFIEQYKVDNYFIDLYLPKFNIAVEIDENHHSRSSNRKSDLRRHNYILNKLNCRLIRVCEDDCPFEIINIIYRHISQNFNNSTVSTEPVASQSTVSTEPVA